MEQAKPLNGLDDDTIIVKMSIEEYIEYKNSKKKKERNIEKGLNGIMKAFNCTKSLAGKISQAEWFQPAIIYKEGRRIIFDKDIAYELSKEHSVKSRKSKLSKNLEDNHLEISTI